MTRTLTDPAAVTAALAEVWQRRGDSIGTVYSVTPCPYSEDELAALDAAGRRVGFLPPALATQQGRGALTRIFPKLESWALVDDSIVTNDESPSGWFDYETAIDVPNTGSDEAGLQADVAAAGNVLLSLNQYIVASEDSFDETGHYLDENGTWNRVASRTDGRIMGVRFDGSVAEQLLMAEDPLHGCLLCGYDLGAGDRGPFSGGRTSTRLHRTLEPDTAQRAVYGPSPVRPPSPTSLDDEWRRQVACLVAAGLHTALGISVDDYTASMPRFAAKPPAYEGRFDIPLVVDPRLPWRELTALAGVVVGGGRLNIDLTPLDERHAPPAQPYCAWVNNWGQRFPDAIAPQDARAELGADELGANMHELLVMHLAYPELNEQSRFFEPLGYVLVGAYETGMVGFDDNVVRTACMYRWRAKAELGGNLHPKAFGIFRPLVRGAQIDFG